MVFNVINNTIVTTKATINHGGSEGDRIRILYTVNGQTESVILDYTIDPNKSAIFKFNLEEITKT